MPVLVKLDAIRWSQLTILTGGSADTPEISPFLWTVFFKIDGTTARVAETGNLDGTATVFPTFGGHGDLGIWAMSPLERVGIPDAYGFWMSELTPIPIDPSIQPFLDLIAASDPSIVVDPPPTFGFIALLLNDGGHIPAHAVAAGYAAFVNGVQTFLDSQLDDRLGINQTSPSPFDLKTAQDAIKDQIIHDIFASMNPWEAGWALSGADSFVVSWVGIFNANDASRDFDRAAVSRPLGTWNLEGSVTITDPCPAEAVAQIVEGTIFENDGAARARRSRDTEAPLQAMRRFRDDGDFSKYPGLISWWREARTNTAEAALILSRDKQMRAKVRRLFATVPAILNKLGDPVPAASLTDARRILKHLEGKGSVRIGSFAHRVNALVEKCEGMTGREILKLFSKNGRPSPPRPRKDSKKARSDRKKK